MKHALFVALSLVAAACGSQTQDASTVAAAQSAPSVAVRTIDGSVAQIARSIEGSTTAVTLNFGVGCGTKLLNVASHLEAARAGKPATLFVNAVASVQMSGVRCMAIILQPKTLVIPGSFNAQSLKVEFQHAPDVSAPADLMGAFPLSGVAVVSTESLCPRGAQCMIGGTILNLSTTLGCVDELGPVAGRVLSVDDATGKARVLVSGVSLTRKAGLTTRCIAANVKAFKVSLPMQFVAKAQVVLAK